MAPTGHPTISPTPWPTRAPTPEWRPYFFKKCYTQLLRTELVGRDMPFRHLMCQSFQADSLTTENLILFELGEGLADIDEVSGHLQLLAHFAVVPSNMESQQNLEMLPLPASYRSATGATERMWYLDGITTDNDEGGQTVDYSFTFKLEHSPARDTEWFQYIPNLTAQPTASPTANPTTSPTSTPTTTAPTLPPSPTPPTNPTQQPTNTPTPAPNAGSAAGSVGGLSVSQLLLFVAIGGGLVVVGVLICLAVVCVLRARDANNGRAGAYVPMQTVDPKQPLIQT